MLFSSLYVPSRLAGAVGDEAWIRAMLEVEAALARAEARAGVIPQVAADEIGAACRAVHVEGETIAREARQAGNPAEPLVRVLRQQVAGDAGRFVHLGATSQDIVDTAGMLVTRRALELIAADAAAAAEVLAGLASEHRHTVMAGRTLLQQALPITFGLKAAQWLAGLTRARASLRRLTDETLAVQFGGAAGTLASLSDRGVSVLHELAAELDLAEPVLPWHAERSRLVEIGASLAITAGAAEKVALDIVLLAQTEVGEVVERGEGRQGGSSTLPHKRNPAGAVLVRACARQVQTQVETLTRAMAAEHERAAGAWQSEWPALSSALAATGGAVAWLRETLDRLEVRPERMAENLQATRGLIMAERVASLLAERLGQGEAHELTRALSRRAVEAGTTLRTVLLADPTVRGALSAGEIEQAMDPASYLGATDTLIDRALEYHAAESKAGGKLNA